MRFLIPLLAIVYPFAIYFSVSYLSPKVVTSLFVVVILARVFLDDIAWRWRALGVGVAVLLIAMHWFMKDDEASLRFYPVIVNVVMFILFAGSLIRKTPIIVFIARKRGLEVGPHNLGYLRNLTIIWVGFFIFNIIVSTWTALYTSMDTWLLYNGFIVYVIMGVIAVAELVTRRVVQKRLLRQS